MNRIKVVICEPGIRARIEEIDASLESYQRIVGGDIEAFYPFEEEVCIVCNKDGKMNGMEANRAVYEGDHKLEDVIYGTFFVCGCGSEYLDSLTDREAERYFDKFELPESPVYVDGDVISVKYVPLGI